MSAAKHMERVIAASARITMLREQLLRINVELPEAERALGDLLAGRDEVPSSPTPTVRAESVTPRQIKAAAIPVERPSGAPIRDGSLSEAFLAIVRSRPLTTSEIFHEMQRQFGPEAVKRDTIYNLSYLARKAGQVEKRECPDTHLDKWYPIVTKKATAA